MTDTGVGVIIQITLSSLTNLEVAHMRRSISALLALLVITCVWLPVSALADMDKAIEYAKQVQKIIDDNAEKAISATDYIEALTLTIKSYEEFELGRGLSTLDMVFLALVLDNYDSKNNDSEETSAYSMVMELQENATEYMEKLFTLVTKDASKNFDNYSFNFDTIQIYVDFVFKYAEARETYFKLTEEIKPSQESE